MAYSQKRSHPRQLRRVQVKFQREGEDRVLHGFTKNLSLSGALISAPDLPPRGARLRLELVGKEFSPVVYGVVVHAHRVPPELRRFAESAMGVRFLETAELVARLLPAAAQGERGAGAANPTVAAEERLAPNPWPISGGRSAGGAAAGDTGGSGSASGRYALGAESERARLEGRSPAAARTPARRATPPPPAAGSPAPDIPPQTTHGMRFPSAADFLAVFRRDLVNGGLFVPSGDPAGLYERVVVSLHLPEPVKRVFKVEARVVQVVEPRPGPDGGRTGGGMGLELIDTDRVLDELQPLVKLLEG
jgi:hypothetical protein